MCWVQSCWVGLYCVALRWVGLGWVGLGWVAVRFGSITAVFREIRHEPWSQMALSFTAAPQCCDLSSNTQLLRALVPGVGTVVEMGIMLTSLVCLEAKNCCYQ